MNKAEVGKLLSVAGAFDRFIRIDDMTVTGWLILLERVPYDLAQKAVVAHYAGSDSGRQLMPFHVLQSVEVEARLSKALILEDVRSAKARGLVAESWPKDALLDEGVRERLFALRREAALFGQIEAA